MSEKAIATKDAATTALHVHGTFKQQLEIALAACAVFVRLA